ncbi:MAG: RdgB/HAM1 family non-canonical purine NTP pyrophosphatase [Nevskiales bacterium]|nr:RdgB/HAM1 family non-canonical purine NTP pyrophosphatase [Nevskiales bacterium]
MPDTAQMAVLASRNPKKLREMQALLEPLGIALRAVSEFSDEEPDEIAPSFVENALIKARHACRVSGLPAIADDSGLEVAALHGAPGVRSARYAGTGADDAANNRKLLAALQGVPTERRGARFVCTMVYLRHPDDPVPLIAQGLWSGHIVETPSGTNGFGYDPLFRVDEQGCTSAELAPELKNRISHRGRAAAELLRLLRG